LNERLFFVSGELYSPDLPLSNVCFNQQALPQPGLQPADIF